MGEVSKVGGEENQGMEDECKKESREIEWEWGGGGK